MKKYLTTALLAVLLATSFSSCIKDAIETDLSGMFHKEATNNVASTKTLETIFDKLNVVAPPTDGLIYGYPEGINATQPAAFTKISLNGPSNYSDPIVLGSINSLGSIQFVKAGTLAASGKPFYYMKYGTRYLATGLAGLYLSDGTQGLNEAFQWIFEAAPAVGGSPSNNYYIYSMIFAGSLNRLQVRWITNATSSVYQKNLIGYGAPAALSTQVFSIRKYSVANPGTN